jgi:hypothetical protein
MKIIKITIAIDGNELEREYQAFGVDEIDWSDVVLSMSDTIETSNEPMKDMPGFEGTLDKLKEL